MLKRVPSDCYAPRSARFCAPCDPLPPGAGHAARKIVGPGIGGLALGIGGLALGAALYCRPAAAPAVLGPQRAAAAVEFQKPCIGCPLDGIETDDAPVAAAPAAPRKSAAPPSSAAPRDPAGLDPAAAADYIARWAPVARAEMRKYGIPASVALAQGLVESGAGTSSLARKGNNHFGMKCFSKTCKPGHCIRHTDDSHKDFFRKYKNAWESWRAHSEMLSGGRYASLKKHGKDAHAWANGLQKIGYATDRHYAEKLISAIQVFGLKKYDE